MQNKTNAKNRFKMLTNLLDVFSSTPFYFLLSAAFVLLKHCVLDKKGKMIAEKIAENAETTLKKQLQCKLSTGAKLIKLGEM